MNTKLIFKALDNDIRLQILQGLKRPKEEFAEKTAQMPEPNDFEGGVSVGTICDQIGVSQSTASLYLDILLRADLVESCRIGKWTLYRRNEQTIREFAEFVGTQL